MKRYIHLSTMLSSFQEWYDSLDDKYKEIADSYLEPGDSYDDLDDEALDFIRYEVQHRWISKDEADKRAATAELPDFLEERPVTFQLRGVNPDWGYDIFEIAEEHGALKASFYLINPKTGMLFNGGIITVYAVPDKQTAYEIFDAVRERHIPTIENGINPVVMDWNQAYLIEISYADGGVATLDFHHFRPKKGA